jgi:hypothetical protein
VASNGPRRRILTSERELEGTQGRKRLSIASARASEGYSHETSPVKVMMAAVEGCASDVTRAHRCNVSIPSLTYSAMRMLRPHHTGNHTYSRSLRVRYNKDNVARVRPKTLFGNFNKPQDSRANPPRQAPSWNPVPLMPVDAGLCSVSK